MNGPACILVGITDSPNGHRIAKLLQFFGVSARTATVAEFLAGEQSVSESSSQIRLFCSSDILEGLAEELGRNADAAQLWAERVHSVFAYSGNHHTAFQRLASRFLNAGHKAVIRFDRVQREWVVSDAMPEFCGAMSGLHIPVGETADASSLSGAVIDESGTAFTTCEYRSVPLFLSRTPTIVDIDDEIGLDNFDIRRHFLPSTPIVMYVKWACRNLGWNSPEISACLVIDDPLLRPQYGFLNYRSLLAAMEQHNFSANIAFIPWNWRRNDPGTVDMFKRYPERYSLSIHGCDHTGGEFGTQDVEVLASKARQAIERMSHHESKSGIHHDRVMVFPQGVFSSTAMQVLKQTQYSASVNTEVLCTDSQRSTVTIADVWDVAVMKYGNFPLFTRRYPSQGIENFAFDILLGKPCIVVVHHDAFQDQGANLVKFIDRLNALNCDLSWRSLGEVVRNSCRQRESRSGAEVIETEMYGSELRVENRSERQRRFSVFRREEDASMIMEVRAGSKTIPWKVSDGRLFCEIDLNVGEETLIDVGFHQYPGNGRSSENAVSKVKTALRRYLSEIRDNYLVAGRISLP